MKQKITFFFSFSSSFIVQEMIDKICLIAVLQRMDGRGDEYHIFFSSCILNGNIITEKKITKKKNQSAWSCSFVNEK